MIIQYHFNFGFFHNTFIIFISEPNIHDPVIVSRIKNKRGVPVFRGTILENESSVQLDQPLQATDADEMGGASKLYIFF